MPEMHDVVKLLLARMERHPEEFNGDMAERDSRSYRWWQAIRLVQENGTAEEKAAIDKGIRKIKLQHAHEMVMDELLNGDERRHKFQEDQEYEEKLLQQMRQQQMTMAQQQITSKYQDVTRLSRYPTHADMEKNGIMSALRNLYDRL